MSDFEFDEFYTALQQEIKTLSQMEGYESFKEEKFTELVMDSLVEADYTDNPALCFYKHNSIKINGYSLGNDEKSLDLFVTIFFGENKPSRISKADLNENFQWVQNFLKKSVQSQFYQDIEESTEAFDLAKIISEIKNEIRIIRLVVISDGIISAEPPPELSGRNIKINYDIWDINRFFKLWTSKSLRKNITIKLLEEFNHPLEYLTIKDGFNYNTYLCIVPGELLAKLYEKYGSRLLEKNVRSFLQFRGAVNRGIKQTILNEPEMFLAYNNGISATAEMVHIKNEFITELLDFQIVNGCQTIVSIYTTSKKEKVKLENIKVMMKLTVINKKEISDEIIPKISRFSNTQNKVNVADFSSNNPFHVRIEEFSRKIWTETNDSVSYMTRWYYERVRGQYINEKNLGKTHAQRKLFEAQNPSKQKFSKTDMAKYINSWEQLPHIVSLGAQKNFNHLMFNYPTSANINEVFFKELISKAILFKNIEKYFTKLDFKGYRANCVTYTLACLSFLTDKQFNLNKIWREQQIQNNLKVEIETLIGLVYNYITASSDGGNITEWCKKEKCWTKLKEEIRKNDIILNESVISDYLPQKIMNQKMEKETIKSKFEISVASNTLNELNAEDWKAIAKWGEHTGTLNPWQSKFALQMGRRMDTGKKISENQTPHASKIIEKLIEEEAEIGELKFIHKSPEFRSKCPESEDKINTLLNNSSDVGVTKILSTNDLVETGAHQSGILVPKNWYGYLPKLNLEVFNPSAIIEVIFKNERSYVRYIYYSKKQEGRLTQIPKTWISTLKSGDSIRFIRLNENKYQLELNSTKLKD